MYIYDDFILNDNDDYISFTTDENFFVILYEDKILYFDGNEINEILPKEKYIFRNAKFIKKGSSRELVILSNNKEDENESVMWIYYC